MQKYCFFLNYASKYIGIFASNFVCACLFNLFGLFACFLSCCASVSVRVRCYAHTRHRISSTYTHPPAHVPEGRSTLSNNFFYFLFFSFFFFFPSLNISYFCFCLSLPLCCYTPVTALCISSRICLFPLRLSEFCAFSVYLLALCFICPYSLFSVPPPCPTSLTGE